MIGTNELILNEATMIEIVEFWLNNKFLHKDDYAPKVYSVSLGNNATGNTFKVVMKSEIPSNG